MLGDRREAIRILAADAVLLGQQFRATELGEGARGQAEFFEGLQRQEISEQRCLELFLVLAADGVSHGEAVASLRGQT